MMMTTVRMVQSTMAAMPTAREIKEKFRASREAISADTMSPRAKAVRTCGGRGGKDERAATSAARLSLPLRCSLKRPALPGNKNLLSPPLHTPPPSPPLPSSSALPASRRHAALNRTSPRTEPSDTRPTPLSLGLIGHRSGDRPRQGFWAKIIQEAEKRVRRASASPFSRAQAPGSRTRQTPRAVPALGLASPSPALPRRCPVLRLRAPRPPTPGSRPGGRTCLGWAAAPPRVAGTTAASPARIQPKPSGRTPRPAEAPREAGKSRRRSETFVRSRGQDSSREWRAAGLCRAISPFLDGCLEPTTLARRGGRGDRICLSAQRREASVFCM